MILAVRTVRRGGGKRVRAWLLLAFALGLAFCVLQIAGYSGLGFGIQDGIYASLFYVMTGLGLAHVWAVSCSWGWSVSRRWRASWPFGAIRQRRWRLLVLRRAPGHGPVRRLLRGGVGVNVFARLGLVLGGLFAVDTVVYWSLQHEHVGASLLAMTAVGFAFLGLYARIALRKARARRPSRSTEEEPHVGPTIWPAVFALSAVGLALGHPRGAVAAGGGRPPVRGGGRRLDRRDAAAVEARGHDETAVSHAQSGDES